jgi:hypothetical protein
MSVKYFPVIQDPNKAAWKRTAVILSKAAYTDENHIPHPEYSRALRINAMGMYTVDMDDEPEYVKRALAFLKGHLKAKDWPLVGEYDDAQEAMNAEIRMRPLTSEQKVALFDQQQRVEQDKRSKQSDNIKREV